MTITAMNVQQKMEAYSKDIDQTNKSITIGLQNDQHKMVSIGIMKNEGDHWDIRLNDDPNGRLMKQLLGKFSGVQKEITRHSDAHYSIQVDGYDISLLYDLFNAPQGFMARLLATKTQELPDDITQWSSDDIFHSLTLVGQDISGAVAYFKDESALKRYNESTLDVSRCLNHNQTLEDQTQFLTQYCDEYSQYVCTSNVGGEKPKVLLNVIDHDQWYSTIVKYSPPGDTVNKEHLIMEHQSMTALREQLGDDSVAHTELYENKETGQVFLVIKRDDRGVSFDLSEKPSRKHWMSEQAIQRLNKKLGDDASTTQISRTVNALKNEKRPYFKNELKASLAHQLTAYAFNKMIGNDDVHGGNLSNVLSDDGKIISSCTYDSEPHALRSGQPLKAISLKQLQSEIKGFPDVYFHKAQAAFNKFKNGCIHHKGLSSKTKGLLGMPLVQKDYSLKSLN